MDANTNTDSVLNQVNEAATTRHQRIGELTSPKAATAVAGGAAAGNGAAATAEERERAQAVENQTPVVTSAPTAPSLPARTAEAAPSVPAPAPAASHQVPGGFAASEPQHSSVGGIPASSGIAGGAAAPTPILASSGIAQS